MKRIPITQPVFDAADREALLKPLESGWVVQGPYVAEFEKRFSEFTTSPHAVATTSCTTALHAALLALGIGPGDDVLVPAFTYVASANAVEYTGARPIFCDIDPITFNLEVRELDKRRSPSTRAVMPVHLFGLAADMKPILAFTRLHGLSVVEDAACGLGSLYEGRHVGTFGEAGCFSFHPRKAITTGEGGMITTASPEIAARCRSLRDHGASQSDLARASEKGENLLPEFTTIGFNYRMTDFQGALGVSQLVKARTILDRRAQVARAYDSALTGLSWLIPPHVPAGCTHSFQSYVCRIREQGLHDNLQAAHRFRNRLMKRLEAAGVSVRQGTHAVHGLEYYRKKYKLRVEDYPEAWAADRLTLTLPLFAQMTEDDVNYVVETLRTCAASLA